MKKLRFLFLLCLLGVYPSLFFAQNNTEFDALEETEKADANLFYRQEEYPKALQAAKEKLKELEENGNTRSIGYANALNTLALIQKKMGIYDESEENLKKALSIKERVYTKYSEQYAGGCNNLAGLYREMGKFDDAEKLYREALQVRQKVHGEYTIPYAESLNNMALFYFFKGDYKRAEILYAQTLLKKEKALKSKKTMSYATSLNNIALLYSTMGRYPEAETHFKQAADIKKALVGENHTEYAVILSNLAVVYKNVGRYTEAEKLLLNSQQVFKNKLGENNSQYASVINLLANLYVEIHRYKDAELLLRQALDINTQLYGEQSPNFAETAHHLAELCMRLKRYEESEKLYATSSQIFLSVFGDKHPNYASSVKNTADLYFAQQKLQEAENLYQKAISIKKTAQSIKHPDFADWVDKLSHLYMAQKRYKEADSLQRFVVRNYIKQINSFFPSMSEREKEQFYAKIKAVFERFHNYALLRYEEDNTFLTEMYNYQLATKALLLNATNKVKKRILASKDTILLDKYNQWLYSRNRLAQLYAMPSLEVQKQGISIDTLEMNINKLEKMLSRKSEVFAQVYENQMRHWGEIRQKLKYDEAAIEIIRLRKCDFTKPEHFTSQIRYVALIISKEHTNPQIVVLENGNELEEKFFNYYRYTIDFKMDDYHSYQAYFAPIFEKVSDKKRLFVSLDGVYNQINLNSLYDTQTESYLFEKTEIYTLSNTKDLLSPSFASKTLNPTAVLFGDPDFQFSPHVSTTLDNNLLAVAASTDENNELTRTSVLFQRLEGAKIEVEKIKNLLDSAQWQTVAYTDKEASEENLKTIISPQILHIATHGFFSQDVKPDELDYKNPLLHSGLMLTGAEYFVKNKETHDFEENPLSEDGILTAFEAMNMSLENTDMVVLSACETGLGHIQNGEGVYGLQRAFRIAGAKTVLMSLWKVDDHTTQMLMTAFYHQWLLTKDKKQAFRNAQLYVRTLKPEPYYWAAFVMIGE